MHSRSCSVKLISSVVKKPLLRMLRWLRVAPFGRPVVPEVYWMLIGSSGVERPRDELGQGHPGVGHVVVGPLRGAEEQHLLEPDVVADLRHHRAVVAGLELRRRDQQPDARLAQGVRQLVGPVGRVDVDQDRADLGGGVLGDRPLGAVGGPDPDPVALADAGPDQPDREGVDVGVELGPGPAPAGRDLDQRLAVGVPGDGRLEVGPDRLLQERRGRLTACCRGLVMDHAPNLRRRCRAG